MFRLNNSNLRAALMLGAATASALSLVGTAKAENVETVVVTGSRIASGFDRPTPVSVLGTQRLEQRAVTRYGHCAFRQDARFEPLAILFKRVANILKAATEPLPPAVDRSRPTEAAERALLAALDGARERTAPLWARGAYPEVLPGLLGMEGAIHGFMIIYEMSRLNPRPDRMAIAKQHFDRNIELCKGHQAGPLVAYAENVLVPQKNRPEFETMLRQALKIDVNTWPEHRQLNLVMQRRAKWLLSRTDQLFLHKDGEQNKTPKP